MFRILINCFKDFKVVIDKNVETFGAQYFSFSIFGIINYPIYYLVWLYGAKQNYESFWLRLIALILCIILALNKKWPQKFRFWLTVYWYGVITYCLPFFFTFMLLKNNASTLWLMNYVSANFFMFFLVDLSSVFFLTLIGNIAAFSIYFIFHQGIFIYIPGIVDFSGVFFTLAAVF